MGGTDLLARRRLRAYTGADVRAPFPDRPVILFDGSCGLCTAATHFILRRARAHRFSFLPLASAGGRRLLTDHGFPPADGTSLVLLSKGRAFRRSGALLRIARGLRWPWPLAAVLLAVPPSLRDACYDFVARRRHRWFRRPAACLTPPAEAAGRPAGDAPPEAPPQAPAS
jgi:predicted DCC family thiol-disulfide oxidoreductase YuxK